jgi:hypothetical protein
MLNKKWIFTIIMLILTFSAIILGYILTKNNSTKDEIADPTQSELTNPYDQTNFINLPKQLSYERLIAIDNEWYIAPHGPIDPTGAGEIVQLEFPENKPKSLNELLAEMVAMYQGDKPFTQYRITSFDYFSTSEPILSQTSKYGLVPIPNIRDSDNQDIRIYDIQDSYKKFKEYVDKINK